MGRKLFQILVIINLSSAALAEDIVSYFQTDLRYAYRIELLKAALDKTKQAFGDYKLQPVTHIVTQGRGISFLAQGKVITVAFLSTTVERERKLLPVKIPILRGILGYRVLLVHQKAADRYRHINSVDQLSSQFVAGFGAHWADIKILRDNGLHVQGVSSYKSIFAMLNASRFDYFPRGINEAWSEFEEFKNEYPNITIEPEIALYYPYPVYFFVNKENKRLRDRIKKGLHKAMDDGTFKALFMKYHQHLFELANLKNRKVLSLTNSTLPEMTDLPDTSWWLPANTINSQGL